MDRRAFFGWLGGALTAMLVWPWRRQEDLPQGDQGLGEAIARIDPGEIPYVAYRQHLTREEYEAIFVDVWAQEVPKIQPLHLGPHARQILSGFTS